MSATYPTFVARKRNNRGSPRKMRLAADLIRGKKVQHATELLEFSVTKSSNVMHKLLASAISNAEQQSADLDSLVISSVRVDKGMVLKRRKPSGRGRMRGVYHRYSHIDLMLEDRSVQHAKPKTATKPKATKKPTADAKPKEKVASKKPSEGDKK